MNIFIYICTYKYIYINRLTYISMIDTFKYANEALSYIWTCLWKLNRPKSA